MITGELKSRIDKLWEEFWTGGITNPLTVIEQISYLVFLRMIDMRESAAERRKARTKAAVTLLYGKDEQHLRWSQLRTETDPAALLKRMRDEVFPHLRTLGREGSALREHNKDAQLFIQKATLLDSAIRMVDALPLEDADVKGDLYEYLLSKLTTAGINGQFRTPRHVIKLMVEMMAPQPTEVVGDPACGTAGFLVAVKEYLDTAGPLRRGAVPRAHPGEDVPRLRLRQHHAPHREHEPGAPWRGGAEHPQPGHPLIELRGALSEALAKNAFDRGPGQSAVQGQPGRQGRGRATSCGW
jgi:hypothetical protein